MLRVLLLAVSLLLMGGCGFPRPSLHGPGPIYHQQQNATIHDPYALDDLGPEVVGSRPRDFQKPRAEPVRDRWFAESWWGQ